VENGTIRVETGAAHAIFGLLRRVPPRKLSLVENVTAQRGRRVTIVAANPARVETARRRRITFFIPTRVFYRLYGRRLPGVDARDHVGTRHASVFVAVVLAASRRKIAFGKCASTGRRHEAARKRSAYTSRKRRRKRRSRGPTKIRTCRLIFVGFFSRSFAL